MRILTTALSALISVSAFAGTTITDLVAQAQQVHPGKRYVSVVCNYDKAKDSVMELAAALGSDYRLLVVDTRARVEIPSATSIILKARPDYMVVLPEDRQKRVCCQDSRIMTWNLKNAGIPTVGLTTPPDTTQAKTSVGVAQIEVVGR